MKPDNGVAENGVSLPLLLCGMVSAQAAAFAVTATMGEALFSLLVHGMLLVGFAAAYETRRRRLPVGLIATVLLVLVLGGFVTRPTGIALGAALFPNAMANDPNLALSNLLVWFLVAFSFLQGRRRQLIFISATGLALFGLIGVINLELGYLIAFAVFAFATIMAWSYDGLLARGGTLAEVDWRRALAGQAVGGAPVLAGAALLAYLLSLLLYTLVPSPFSGNLMYRPLASWAGRLVQGGFYALPELAVGYGPARLGDEVLFKVKAERPGLWRISLFDHYDGHVWSRSLTNTEALCKSESATVYVMPEPEGPQRRYNRQEYWAERGTTGVILAAANPVRVELGSLFGMGEEQGGEERTGPRMPLYRVYQDAYGALSVVPVRQPWTGYTVYSAMTDWAPGDLRRAKSSVPPTYRQRYVEDVPLPTAQALTPLVQEITAGATNNYDKTALIQRWLEENCFYTDAAPITPANQDAVSYFVLTTRRGACDLFASAMAMMLRIAGVPARVATGFITGPLDPQTGFNDLRAKDAHAWVEAYFPGYDWISFNPTPDRELEKQPLWQLLRQGQTWYVVGQVARKAGLGLLAAVAVLLILASAADPRMIGGRLRSMWRRRDPWERVARESTRAAQTALFRAGLRPIPGETPLEMAKRVEGGQRLPEPRLRARLQSLIGEFYRARFGRGPVQPGLSKRLAREFRRLRKRLRRRER